MTIDNQCGQDNTFNSPLGSPAEAHAQLALEHAALYAARVAIARWSASSSVAVDAAAPVMQQAHWYAQAQQNFEQWLACGGFSQHELAVPVSCLTFVAGGELIVTPLPGHMCPTVPTK